MQRIAAVALMLVFAACQGRSPTDPTPLRGRSETAVAQNDRYTLTPSEVVLKPGQSASIAVRLNGGISTLGVVFDCDGPCTVARIEGGIPQWSAEGVIVVRAVSVGTARIRATSRTFGGSSTVDVIGDIRVSASARQRSVRH